MSDRCEKCEQVAAELRAELRAEFDKLPDGFVRGIDENLDRSQPAIDKVHAQISAGVANIEARNLGVLADIDRRMQRLLDRLSERLLLPPQEIDEEPPRRH